MSSTVTITLNPAVDKSVSVDRVVPEQKLRCEPNNVEPGGGGLNVSRALQRLGRSSDAWYLAGGPTGQILDHLLDEEQISQRAFPIEEWTRENFIASETSTQLQYRFGLPGPTVQQYEVEQLKKTLTGTTPSPSLVVLSGSLPPGTATDLYRRLADIVQEQGGRTVLDTAGRPLQESFTAPIFAAKPNVGELASLYGNAINGDKELLEAAEWCLNESGWEVLLVSLGSKGALLATQKEMHYLNAPTVPVKSKVGAGDSMVAGFVRGLAENRSILEAARLGVAAGSAAVMTPGTELCTRADTERLFPQIHVSPANTTE